MFLTLGIWFASCKTSRNIGMQKQVDYRGEFQFLRNAVESLRTDVSKQTKITTDKLSDLKIENTTVYFSSPDSIGKQYPIKESTTTASKREQERMEIDETLSLALKQFSNRLDSLNGKVDVMLNLKEKIVEISWWDIYEGKLYCAIVGLLIIIFLHYGYRNK